MANIQRGGLFTVCVLEDHARLFPLFGYVKQLLPTEMRVNFCIPQGSVPGLLTFLIIINDIFFQCSFSIRYRNVDADIIPHCHCCYGVDNSSDSNSYLNLRRGGFVVSITSAVDN